MADRLPALPTGTYTMDVISVHRRQGKIYDLIKIMVASKLGEETK